jgi:hypothetical protein
VDRNRLAQLLGMLDSAFAGERDNAARLAVRMVKEAGLTWPQLLDGESVATEAARILFDENEQLKFENQELQEQVARLRRPPLPKIWVLPRTPNEQIAQAIDWTGLLTDWEREFITDMSARWRPPTERQQEVLDRISNKIAGTARARGLYP